MNYRFFLILIIVYLYAGIDLIAQTASATQGTEVLKFSLEQAQAYASENNYDLKNSSTDVEIARKMVKQNTSIGLPQVSGNIDYTNYLVIPTTMLPGEIQGKPAGTYIPVQFGTPFNATLKATITQLIYSGQYLVGLQTAKAFLETSKQKNVRDKVDVRDQVADAYIRLLVVDESIKILDSTYVVVSKLVEEARKSYEAGLIEDIDVDQADLNKSNLAATITYTRNMRNLGYASLKFIVGLKDNQELVQTDNLEFFLAQVNRDALVNQQFDYNSNLDYVLLKKADYLTLMQYKLSKTAYQPSLSGFLTGSTAAQRNEWNFVKTSESWYPTAIFGVSLQIPIWSSGSRKYTVDQARLNVAKTKVTDEKMRVGLQLQVATAKTDFSNAYAIYQNKVKGFQTALKIYEKTLAKYKQGMVGSTDLNQRYNQFLVSNSDYMQSIYTVLSQKIKLTKLLEKY
ncbi:MAG: TolC family protein [Bacteroidetes bacterium]|nr:TolC family protein [Bacteroidota bacterium]